MGGSATTRAVARAPPGEEPSTTVSMATPGYLDAMRIPLRAGRWFDERDDAEAVAVAVVNETLARQHWPDGDPRHAAGDRAAPGGQAFEGVFEAEIVGVVGAVRPGGFDSPPRPEVFIPHAQAPPCSAPRPSPFPGSASMGSSRWPRPSGPAKSGCASPLGAEPRNVVWLGRPRRRRPRRRRRRGRPARLAAVLADPHRPPLRRRPVRRPTLAAVSLLLLGAAAWSKSGATASAGGYGGCSVLVDANPQRSTGEGPKMALWVQGPGAAGCGSEGTTRPRGPSGAGPASPRRLTRVWAGWLPPARVGVRWLARWPDGGR